MKQARTKTPTTRKYRELFGHWLQMNGFDDIDKSDRAHLLQMMENLHEVEAWRASLKPEARVNLNSPSATWVVSRIFRTFGQATASVCVTCG